MPQGLGSGTGFGAGDRGRRAALMEDLARVSHGLPELGPGADPLERLSDLSPRGAMPAVRRGVVSGVVALLRARLRTGAVSAVRGRAAG